MQLKCFFYLSVVFIFGCFDSQTKIIETYYPDNKSLRQKGYYKDNKLIKIESFSLFQVKTKEESILDSLLHGEYSEYYPENGKLKYRCEFRNGKPYNGILKSGEYYNYNNTFFSVGEVMGLFNSNERVFLDIEKKIWSNEEKEIKVQNNTNSRNRSKYSNHSVYYEFKNGISQKVEFKEKEFPHVLSRWYTIKHKRDNIITLSPEVNISTRRMNRQHGDGFIVLDEARIIKYDTIAISDVDKLSFKMETFRDSWIVVEGKMNDGENYIDSIEITIDSLILMRSKYEVSTAIKSTNNFRVLKRIPLTN